MARDNTRGLRRIVRLLQKPFRPAVPFISGTRARGFGRGLLAPDHVWRRYTVPCSTRPRTIEAAPYCGPERSSCWQPDERSDAVRSHRERGSRKSTRFRSAAGRFCEHAIVGRWADLPSGDCCVACSIGHNCARRCCLGESRRQYGNDLIASALSHRGIRVLINESIAIKTAAGLVHVVGLADHSTGNPEIERALSGYFPANIPQ